MSYFLLSACWMFDETLYFNVKISILEKAMHLHKQLAPSELQRLHEFLEEKFETLKQQIHESVCSQNFYDHDFANSFILLLWFIILTIILITSVLHNLGAVALRTLSLQYKSSWQCVHNLNCLNQFLAVCIYLFIVK